MCACFCVKDLWHSCLMIKNRNSKLENVSSCLSSEGGVNLMNNIP